MSKDFKRVTVGDRNRLAADMFERDLKDGSLEGDDSLDMYTSVVHDVVQSAIDAGWEIRVPKGWRIRENT